MIDQLQIEYYVERMKENRRNDVMERNSWENWNRDSMRLMIEEEETMLVTLLVSTSTINTKINHLNLHFLNQQVIVFLIRVPFPIGHHNNLFASIPRIIIGVYSWICTYVVGKTQILRE